MLNEKAPLSLYYQLKEALIKRVKEKEWTVNTKIPTERELCELYSVSRITVRQALDAMEEEGYLYRKQGKGTFVTAPKLKQRLNDFYSFSEEIRKMGFEPDTKILDFKIIESNDITSQNLEIGKGEKVYAVKRLRLADKVPFTVETSYIPYEVAVGLTKEEVENNGLYNTLKNTFSIMPNEAIESFEAVLVPNEYALYLDVKKNSAALKIERTTKAKDRVVEYCESIIRGDRYKYTVYLK